MFKTRSFRNRNQRRRNSRRRSSRLSWCESLPLGLQSGLGAMTEALEDRTLLSAEGLADSLLGGLEQFGFRVQEAVEDPNSVFQTKVPGVLRQDPDFVSRDSDLESAYVIPNVTDTVGLLVNRDTDRVRSGIISRAPSTLDRTDPLAVYEYVTSGDPLGGIAPAPNTEFALNAMDTEDPEDDGYGGYGFVNYGEAFRVLVAGAIAYHTTENNGTSDLETFLSEYGGAADINVKFSNVMLEESDEHFTASFTVSMVFQDSRPYVIDLGSQAEELGISIPEKSLLNQKLDPDLESQSNLNAKISVRSELSVPMSFTVDTSGTSVDADDFQATLTGPAQLRITDRQSDELAVAFTDDASRTVNVGFLGTRTTTGSSFNLSIPFNISVQDPSTPEKLGFQSPTTDVNRLAATSSPESFSFATPILFDLRLGNGDSETPIESVGVSVSATANDSLEELRQDVQAGISGTLLGDLIQAGTVDDRLTLRLPEALDLTPLGFSSNEIVATGGLLADTAPDALVGTTAPQTIRFLLSADGNVPQLVNVTTTPENDTDAEGGLTTTLTFDGLIDDINAALPSGFQALLHDGSRVQIAYTDDVLAQVQATRTLTLSAETALDFSELGNVSGTDLFSAEPVAENGSFRISLVPAVKEGIQFTPAGSPQLAVSSEQIFDSEFQSDTTEVRGTTRFNLDLQLTDFDQLLGFNVIGPADVVSLISQLAAWAERYRDTAVLRGQDIPFSQAGLGQLLDFANLIEDELLGDPDAEADDGRYRLVMPGNQLDDELPATETPVFVTAQTLARKLHEFDLSPDDSAGYSAGTTDRPARLLYQLGISHEFDGTQSQLSLDAPNIDTFRRAYFDGSRAPTADSESSTDVDANEITFARPHGFTAGEPVVYRNGANGKDVSGLSDGITYYVISVSARTLKLAETPEAAAAQMAIDLERLGTGSQHSLTPHPPNLLDPLSNVSSQSRVRLDATGSFQAIVGIELGAEVPITDDSSLQRETSAGVPVQEAIKSGLAVTGASAVRPIVGRLQRDAQFRLTVVTGEGEATQTLLLRRAATNDNRTPADLVSDLNASLSELRLPDGIRVFDGKDSNGQLSADANFTIQIDATTFEVVVRSANTDGSNPDEATGGGPANTSRSDLVEDLNAAINEHPELVGRIVAELDRTTIVLRVTDPSRDRQFSITAEPGNPAITELGFAEELNYVGGLLRFAAEEQESARGEVQSVIRLEPDTPAVRRFRLTSSSGNAAYRELGLQPESATTAVLAAREPVRRVSSFSDATFKVTLHDGETATEATVTVPSARTLRNRTVTDLVFDFNAALSEAGLLDRLLVTRDRNRLIFNVIDASTTWLRISEVSSAAVNHFGLAPDDSTISLTAPNRVTDLDPEENAEFHVSINGETPIRVTIPFEYTPDAEPAHASVAELVEAIATELEAVELASLLAVTHSQERVIFFAKDPTVNSLRITAARNDPAVLDFGLAEDVQISRGTLDLLSHRAMPFFYGPDGDAVFDVTIEIPEGPISATVTVPGGPVAVNNRSLPDLVSDINRALRQAEDSHGNTVDLTAFIVTNTDAGRIVLSARPLDDDAPETQVSFLSVTSQDAADPAVVDFRLYQATTTGERDQPPATGPVTLTGDSADLLIATRDGTLHRVELDDAETIGQVRELMILATGGSGLLADGTLEPGSVDVRLNDARNGLELEETTDGTAEFQVTSVNGSDAAFALGILKSDAEFQARNRNVRTLRDGKIVGNPIFLTTLDERLFLQHIDEQTPLLSAEVGVGLSEGIRAKANYGFVEVNLTAPGDITALGFSATGIKPFETDELGHFIADRAMQFPLVNSETDPAREFRFPLGFLDSNSEPVTRTVSFTSRAQNLDEFLNDLNPALRNVSGTVVARNADGRVRLNYGLGEYVEIPPTRTFQGRVEIPLAQPTEPTFLADLVNAFTKDQDSDDDVDLFDIAQHLTFPELDLVVQATDDDGSSMPNSVKLDLSVPPPTSGLDFNDAQVVIEIEDVGNPFAVAIGTETGNDASDLVPVLPSIQVNTSDVNLDDLKQVDEVAFADLIEGFEHVAQFLEDQESEPFRTEGLPLIGESLNDLFGVAERFREAVEDVRQNPARSIQQLEQKLREVLGLENDVLKLSLLDNEDGDSAENDMLKISLNLSRSFNKALAVELDVSEEIPIEGFAQVGLFGGADLPVRGDLTLKLAFGVDLDAPTDPSKLRLFTSADDTSIAANLNAETDNLTFNASLGPLGVFVSGGDATAELMATLSDPDAAENSRAPFDDALDGFTPEVTGSIETTLPVFFPTQSSYRDDITFDAALSVTESTENPGDLVLDTESELVVGAGITDLDFADFDLFDNILLAINGLDVFLTNVQDIVDGEVLSNDLPLIGDSLSDGGDFIETVRRGVLQQLRELVQESPLTEQPGEDAARVVQTFLFDVLGPGPADERFAGLELLRAPDGSPAEQDDRDNIDQIVFTQSDFGDDRSKNFVQWNFVIGDLYTPDIDADFDLGLPALNLDVDAQLETSLGWMLGLGIGISIQDGVYIDVRRDDTVKVDFARPQDPSLVFGPTEPLGNSRPELLVFVEAKLQTRSELKGELGFLQLDVTAVDEDFDTGRNTGNEADGAADPTRIFAEFAVDIFNGSDPDAERLRLFDIGNLDAAAGLRAGAQVNLDLAVGFNEQLLPDAVSALLPAVGANFVLDWSIDGELNSEFTLEDGLKLIEFQEVYIDAGSFLSDTIRPIVAQVQEVTAPLEPIIDVLTEPIPVISDLAGSPITFVDIAELFGEVDLSMIEAIADLVSFVNTIPTDGTELRVPLGDFKLYDTHLSDTQQAQALLDIDASADLANPNFTFDAFSTSQISEVVESLNPEDFIEDLTQPGVLDAVLGDVSNDAGKQQSKSGLEALFGGDVGKAAESDAGGFAFPLWEDPSKIFGLFLGRFEDVTLVTYDLPPLGVEFSYTQRFPVFGPLFAVLTGEVGFSVDLAFGYDLAGVKKFADGDFRNPLDLLAGLFISDTNEPDGTFGVDVPELVLSGGIFGGVELNVGVASAGAEGGVLIGVNFDLYDPNRDGKVRVDELISTFQFEFRNGDAAAAPLAIFDISGEVAAQLRVYIEILFTPLEFRFPSEPAVLFTFEVPFDREPILATELGNGSLLLNMGQNSTSRLNGDLDDLDEEFYVKSLGGGRVAVWSPTLGVNEEAAQTYRVGSGGKVIAFGGEGDDKLDTTALNPIAVEFDGGSGDDTFRGGAGDDAVLGGLGNDSLAGGLGRDTITGGAGRDTIIGGPNRQGDYADDDILFGDTGTISSTFVAAVHTPNDDADSILGGWGNDIIFGTAGRDTLSGGQGHDSLFGDGGRITTAVSIDNVLILEPDPNIPNAFAGLSAVDRPGGENDVISGEEGNDLVYGGRGNDNIDGGAGDDTLFGNSGFDRISGKAGGDSIIGGAQDDLLFGFDDPALYPADEDFDADDGQDVIHGEAGNDSIRGNRGNDSLYGNAGADTIFGDAGNDILEGNNEPDLLFGGADSDTIHGGTSDDIALGDDGFVVYFNDDPAFYGGTHLVIGDGVLDPADPLVDAHDGNPRTLDLIQTVINAATDGMDQIIGGEGHDILLGGGFGDTQFGDLDPETTLAGPTPFGNDLLIGDGGRVELADRFRTRIQTLPGSAAADAGHDSLSGNGGNDSLLGGGGSDQLFGRQDPGATPVNADEPAAVTDHDVLVGDDGTIELSTVERQTLLHRIVTDRTAPSGASDTAHGGPDDDILFGGQSGDFLYGESGNDVVIGDNGEIQFAAGQLLRVRTTDDSSATGGSDSIEGSSGDDFLFGGVANDTVLSASGADVALGDGGEIRYRDGMVELVQSIDTTLETGGDDLVDGARGPDTLIGGVGSDTLRGQTGDDILIGDNGLLDYDTGDEDLTTLDRIVTGVLFVGDVEVRSDLADPSITGDDQMSGGDGADTLFGGGQGDVIGGDEAVGNGPVSTPGEDVVLGDNGEILLVGGRNALIRTTDTETDPQTGGNDRVLGNVANDIILGGVGSDSLNGNDGADVILGDNGLLDYDTGDGDLTTLDLIQTTEFQSGDADIIGGDNGSDTLIGGDAADLIVGDNGVDAAALATMPGDDVIVGDQAEITLATADVAGVAKNFITLIRTTDTVEADGGADTISGNDGADTVLGGVAGDLIHGEAALVSLQNTPGDDVLVGDEGVLQYDVDGDPASLDRIRTVATGSLGGNDRIFGNDGNDTAIGGRGDDEIHGDVYLGNSLLMSAPAPGEDVLIGDGGEITYAATPVTLIRSIETDQGGQDTVSGNTGNDTILGGMADDLLYGEADGPLLSLMSGTGDDIILGDNGRLDFVLATDQILGRSDVVQHLGGVTVTLDGESADPSTLDRITTTAPTHGGSDSVWGNGGSDTVFGGTIGDVIRGDTSDSGPGADGPDSDDLLFGDHGKLYPQLPTLDPFFVNNHFFAVDVEADDAGFDDTVFGNAGDDVILGQQGDDVLFGGADNDDVLGGHNVHSSPSMTAADDLDLMDEASIRAILPDVLADWNPHDNVANELNDVIDGGTGHDVITGDNGIVIRGTGPYGGAHSTNQRFRALTTGTMYTVHTVNLAGLYDVDVSFSPNVSSTAQVSPVQNPQRVIVLLDHADAVQTDFAVTPGQPRPFGNDVMAGSAGNDVMLGQLGDDILQGDGSISVGTGVNGNNGSFLIPNANALGESLAFQLAEDTTTDGDDYMEGNGGNDLLYGNLGQDDLIGGSSEMFGLVTSLFGVGIAEPRPDGADEIYGGAGLRTGRNSTTEADDPLTEIRHARDADMILGDNAEIYRLVQVLDEGTVFETFHYDQATGVGLKGAGYSATQPVIPRAARLVDYSYSIDPDTLPAVPSFQGIGAGDLLHGESGDDTVHGMTGDDVLRGDAEDDDLYGEAGHDWISGGTGKDGILGDDGLIATSRNQTASNDGDEPLYGIAAFANRDLDLEIATPGNIHRALINVNDALRKTVDLVAFDLASDLSDIGANDILYGGLGDDWLHGGSGSDAVSGAEALPVYFAGGAMINSFLQLQQQAPLEAGAQLAAEPFWFDFAPYNPGDILRFEGNGKPGEFALYDEFHPRRKIVLDASATELETYVEGTSESPTYDFLLNFDAAEGPLGYAFQTDETALPTDGDDRIFGDLGADWLVGGTGRDHMYGGRGDDLLNADDNHDSTISGDVPGQKPQDPPLDPLANSIPDAYQAYADIFYGGAGRDVLILNTGADRSIDWVGEFNSYIAPFAPFGAFHISRSLMPHLQEYLYDLSKSDGADQTAPDGARYAGQKSRDVRVDEPDPLRNGEPYGELGLVLQQDFDWQDQTGGPADPQAGNIPGGRREIMRRELFTDPNAPQAFAVESGAWSVTSGRYLASGDSTTREAISLQHLDQWQPSYMEVLATVNAEKDKAGVGSNGYILFDYQNPTDFKFAGIDLSIDKLQIGHRTAEGWIVDVQSPMQLRDGRNYQLFVKLHGQAATLVVDDAQAISHVFADSLNDGMLGLAVNNSVTRFDDFQVQKLPPVIAAQITESFDDGVGDPLQVASGQWAGDNGAYAGTPDADGAAVARVPLVIQPLSYVELETQITSDSFAGLMFDAYSATDFKFAAVLPETQQVVIGHRTSRGWFSDAITDQVLTPANPQQLKLTLQGATVNVLVNEQPVLAQSFHSLITDGDVGLVARRGPAVFDDLTIRSSDPQLAIDPGGEALHASVTAEDSMPIPHTLTHAELAPVAGAAVAFWSARVAAKQLARLGNVHYHIVNLPHRLLGRQSDADSVWIDETAAGHGWFSEDVGLNANGRMNLFAALVHELGHLLGREHGELDSSMSPETFATSAETEANQPFSDGIDKTVPRTTTSSRAVRRLADSFFGFISARVPRSEPFAGQTGPDTSDPDRNIQNTAQEGITSVTRNAVDGAESAGFAHGDSSDRNPSSHREHKIPRAAPIAFREHDVDLLFALERHTLTDQLLGLPTSLSPNGTSLR